jgi:pimeloyl-ACP methyl ester carboxylesterase
MAGSEVVVLLHGMGRTSLSFVRAKRRLRRAGYRPLSLGYPSRRRGIPELAQNVARRLRAVADAPIHFVTHSLGGILLRYLRQQGQLAQLGRVVMLGPPNRGSQLAQRLRTNTLYRWATGPAGQQLGTDEESIPLDLGPVDFELGVIAGDRPFRPLTGLIRGAHDGLVAVEEARVEGMVDFLVVPCGHTFMMNDPAVLDQAIHFLRHGRFLARAARGPGQGGG